MRSPPRTRSYAPPLFFRAPRRPGAAVDWRAMTTAQATRLLDLLWERYAAEVPYARTFVQLSGGSFRNDHVALRSLARPGGGIALFSRPFERLGWKAAGAYTFPDAHLSAIYMSHPAGLPRVFISELKSEELSPRARE